MPTQGAAVKKLAGTKTRIDAALIIEAGLRIASEPGSGSVTVRELGKALHADPTSIYRHFRNKDALMKALLDRIAEMALERVTAPREQWRERLRQSFQAFYDLYMEYPAIGEHAILLSTEGPAELDVVELTLECLSEAGLRGDDLVRHYAAISTYVLAYTSGIARSEAARASGPLEDTSAWFRRSLPMSPSTHPHVNALRDPLSMLDDADAYQMGIEALLDGVEATAQHLRATRTD
ncbi:TetR/AcrR family transcriptional regulator [Paeniglutamicibacter cryotolerans]|uniref:AcrR family transcriptional regulator n=1 Tax=Paeniglutamicibacter cryotolerans TaxID=670079 RepID=A0A839QHU9_9MICC|nr:TetR/AcrR family transcriptional regulator [Paeniglutamicibacter cryotolerans]MBB2995347.1 AcrR family transcriptional regulator [Paeniglutamicibacter cryotolerans]